MKEIFITFAKYNEEANKAIAGILGKLSSDEREKNRKSFYGSLTGLFLHNAGCAAYFLPLFKDAVSGNAEALKALEPLAKFGKFMETLHDAKDKNGKPMKRFDSKTGALTGKLSDDEWKKLVSAVKITDKVFVDFANALKEEDMAAPVMIDWYKGKPPSAPLWFMLQQFSVHNTHHRGQISQILDSLGIEHDFSGINVKFL